jgi:hypothetical protein
MLMIPANAPISKFSLSIFGSLISRRSTSGSMTCPGDERETDFPFLYFLVVVTAREYNVSLVFRPEQESPRHVDANPGAGVAYLVVTIFTLDNRRLGLGTNNSGTEGEERRHAPVGPRFVNDVNTCRPAVRKITQNL